MPARPLTEVFNLFKRLHPQHLYDGVSGMGLAIVKRIFETMNGAIRVESEHGRKVHILLTTGTAEFIR